MGSFSLFCYRLGTGFELDAGTLFPDLLRECNASGSVEPI